jgi:predicted TIM-barrel fold metal-dependent hydrolase
VHCFDPDKYSYKTPRAYTPRPAPLEALFQQRLTDNVMLVQATIEPDFRGLLAKLEECRAATCQFSGVVRGTILADNDISTLADEDLERMHLLGVRCIRLHGSYGGSGHDLEWVRSELKALARLKAVLQYGWSISAQLPLETWSRLKPYILTDPDLAKVTVVADHIASATPADYKSLALRDFTDLLRCGRVYVKVSALHRRNPGDIQALKPVINMLAEIAPRALLWGSDWPHVNTSHNNFEEGPLKGADAAHELTLVKSWLSEEQRQYMLIHNPRRLFGT